MPNVEIIRGLNLPGTPRATSTCRGTPLLYIFLALFLYIPLLVSDTLYLFRKSAVQCVGNNKFSYDDTMKIVAKTFCQMYKAQHMKLYQATCLTTEKSGSKRRQKKQIFLSHKPEVSICTRPSCNTMGTGSTFLAKKVDKACNFLLIYM